MKKIINIVLVFAILITYFIPIKEVHALECTGYKLSEANSDGTINDLSCYTNYDEAKTAMIAHNSTSTNVAVIYNAAGTLINAKYAIAKLLTNNEVINLYTTPNASLRYTYVNPSYGIDAAFIDYDPATNMAKIRISGYTGWTKLSNISILPVSQLSTSLIRVVLTPKTINIRSEHNTSSNILGSAVYGNVYRFYEKYNDGTYIWYRIQYEGSTAWIASLIGGNWTTESVNSGLQTYYEAYSGTGNLLHRYENKINNYVQQSFNNLGPSPSFLTLGSIYYSFDGNYFYNNVTDMLDDYRDNSFSKAINANNPYYAYYLYLPTRSKTGYTADDFNQYIINKGYNRNMENGVQYVIYNSTTHTLTFNNLESRSGISLLYNEGQSFVDAANTYGVNALMMFGTAINESGEGRSEIAFYKKNLFGLGASDSNPVDGARSYSTVRDSIFDFAQFTGSSSSAYSNPTGSYYFGSHYGNKGSGMNVNYASDPYWGEKQAANSYKNDLSFGLQDFESNTIGVTNKQNVQILKQPSTSSDIIYTLKNSRVSVNNIPVVVADKIYTYENNVKMGWYKVYTDAALDDNQNVAAVTYQFNKSFGYISDNDLYVVNNQPVINADNVVLKTGQSFSNLDGVTAIDIEDGNLTSNVKVTGNIDPYTIGVYYLTYTVEDTSKFSVSRNRQIVVVDTDDPVIVADNREISQYTAFDPLKNVKVVDKTDGDLTSSLSITFNNVNTNELGTYQVTYSVTNSVNKTTTKTINIFVLANKSPVITANDKVVSINSLLDPLSGVGATDYEDGIITSNILVTANNVNMAVAGNYNITYQVTDSANNTSTKTISIKVEDKVYTVKKGDFYYNKLEFSNNKLNIEGSLAILGIDNIKTVNISYDLIFKNNTNDTEYVLPLNRWLIDHPDRGYTDKSYDYKDSWFNGSLDLSGIPQGEYTLYVRARSDLYESKNLFRNVFSKTMTRNGIDTITGRGYQFRNNNYINTYPIELFIRDNGLLSNTEPPHLSNMYNSYDTLDIVNGYLNIVGKSYNINGNYAASSTVDRYFVLENKDTYNRYTYNIGSYVGAEIPMRVSDGLSKVRGWFDTKDKIDLSSLPVGDYIIYIRTRTGAVNDFGELNDIFLKGISNPSTSTVIKTGLYNGKSYTVSINLKARYRLELNIK